VAQTALSAIAFTRGPGLLGSLLVGTSFAKGLAAALRLPLIDVNHLHAHVLAHFIQTKDTTTAPPQFPFLCLLASGGNSQIIRVDAWNRMEVIGRTIDDAAGEAFDKCAKVMGLPYPGGPVVDRLAQAGNPQAFRLARPRLAGYDYSFSGLKTSFLYLLRDQLKLDPAFVETHREDLCACLQAAVVDILMDKLIRAAQDTGIREIALAGGVSANSGLRKALTAGAEKYDWQIYLPPLAFTTDNAAMVAMCGHFKYIAGEFCGMDVAPFARVTV
jgi:N6-L-threonylcarbamoyladenine synthase